MIILLEIMFFLALGHFIYESVLAPSWRLSLRFGLFALRDEVQALEHDSPDDEHYVRLQDSINTMIAMLHRYDVAAVVAAELRYRRDPLFRRQIDVRGAALDDCDIPQVQGIRRRSIDVMVRAIAVSSGMLCAPLYPFVLMGIGFPTLQKRLRRLAVLSRPELERAASAGPGLAVN